jgi:hypothetical protein
MADDMEAERITTPTSAALTDFMDSSLATGLWCDTIVLLVQVSTIDEKCASLLLNRRLTLRCKSAAGSRLASEAQRRWDEGKKGPGNDARAFSARFRAIALPTTWAPMCGSKMPCRKRQFGSRIAHCAAQQATLETAATGHVRLSRYRFLAC